jgi:hypothetical protein
MPRIAGALYFDRIPNQCQINDLQKRSQANYACNYTSL